MRICRGVSLEKHQPKAIAPLKLKWKGTSTGELPRISNPHMQTPASKQMGSDISGRIIVPSQGVCVRRHPEGSCFVFRLAHQYRLPRELGECSGVFPPNWWLGLVGDLHP